jgi:hypothetical protein
MFRLFRRSNSHPPADSIVQALASNGLPQDMDPATLAVVEQRGSYAGRQVRYFRAFDPVRAAERGIQVRQFADLDTHPELVLGSGHLEHDGKLVLSQRDRSPLATTFTRRAADRAAHGDDERFVFPEGDGQAPTSKEASHDNS